jgi:hypothetical protein
MLSRAPWPLSTTYSQHSTEDLDILVSAGDFERRASGLILLTSIRSEVGILVDDWPVQFLPVASPLDEEALAQACDIDVSFEGEKPIKVRILRAEYLVRSP